MSKPSARDRLAQAAFDLFDERGYEQTTVDDITERAGLGRTTFFRYYRSKEDVIFPDHDRLLGLVRDRLLTSGQHTALAAVADAVRLVLLHYLAEGDLARRRYALTSTVSALRDREIASVARYQRLFREFIADRMGEPGEPASLRAELMAATDWPRYGFESGNPKCANCMVHSGFEASAVHDTFFSWQGFKATVKATFSSLYPDAKALADLARFELNPSQPGPKANGLVQIEKV